MCARFPYEPRGTGFSAGLRDMLKDEGYKWRFPCLNSVRRLSLALLIFLNVAQRIP